MDKFQFKSIDKIVFDVYIICCWLGGCVTGRGAKVENGGKPYILRWLRTNN